MPILNLYNPKDLYRLADAASAERYGLVEDVFRSITPDVAVVLELPGGTGQAGWLAAEAGLRRLGRQLGMESVLPGTGGAHAAVPGNHHQLGLGLLWRTSAVNIVPGSWGTFTQDLWHALCWARFDFGDFELTVAGFHGAPQMDRTQEVWWEHQVDEARLLVEILGRLEGPVCVLGDWNTTAARIVPGTKVWYDPEPFTHDLLPAPVDGSRPLQWEADSIMMRAGWFDAAFELDEAWRPTTGHWPSERHGCRRLDRGLFNAEALALLDGYVVVNIPTAREASDHLPVGFHVRKPSVE